MKNNHELLKNQKGLTLIELLAVIVILGIIAAIAIPSVSSIISNTRKNAHIESAKLLITAATYKVNNEGINNNDTFSLDELKKDGYVERISDPSSSDNESYHLTNTKVEVFKTGEVFTYRVCLAKSGTATYYIGPSCKTEKQINDDDNAVKGY